jgi:uncharacterized protein YndB with AHSA1/START domain
MSENKLEITRESDFEIKMTRSFDAPRARVWDALTKPELLQKWLLGPDGWTMPVCLFDLRPGGSYRYVWRSEKDGSEMGMGGVFREVTPQEQFVATERFDEAWYPGDALVTNVFTEHGGKTTLTCTVRYETNETRETVLASGMADGVAASYDRLDALLRS